MLSRNGHLSSLLLCRNGQVYEDPAWILTFCVVSVTDFFNLTCIWSRSRTRSPVDSPSPQCRLPWQQSRFHHKHSHDIWNNVNPLNKISIDEQHKQTSNMDRHQKKEKRSRNNWPNQLSVCQCDIAVRTKQKKKPKTEGYFMVISRFYHRWEILTELTWNRCWRGVFCQPPRQPQHTPPHTTLQSAIR